MDVRLILKVLINMDAYLFNSIRDLDIQIAILIDWLLYISAVLSHDNPNKGMLYNTRKRYKKKEKAEGYQGEE